MMTKLQAAQAKAQWLSQCLDFGWQKSDLDGLSEVWDKFKDENGNMRKEPLPSPGDNQSLEEAADKYSDSQGVTAGDEYLSLTSSSLRQGLKAAYLAGLQRHTPAVVGDIQQRAKEYSDGILKKWGNQSPESEKNFDSEIFDAFMNGAFHERADESKLKRLYDWIMDENRKGAIFAFTSGWLRNVAKEIEFRIAGKPTNLKISFQDCQEFDKNIPDDQRWLAAIDGLKLTVTAPTKQEAFQETIKSIEVLIAYQSGIGSEELKSLASRPSIDIVDELRKANPYMHDGFYYGWDKAADKLKELLNQSK